MSHRASGRASSTATSRWPLRRAAAEVKWFGYFAGITSAATKKPTIAQQRFTEKPMHYGQICNQGIVCSVSGGDRTMADFFGFAADRAGALRVVYNDTT